MAGIMISLQSTAFPSQSNSHIHPCCLGGRAANVFKRVVAWGDGWIPNEVSPDEVREGRVTLDELAEGSDRDPASIEVSLGHVPADRRLIEQYADAGADRAIVRLDAATEDESLAQLERIASSVLR